MEESLKNPVRYLKGVGEKRAALLSKLGVFTVEDLMYLLPRRYIDYSNPFGLREAPFDENCAVRATVLQKNPPVRVRSGRVLYKVFCSDDSAGLEITFFNTEYTVKSLEVGREYIFYGKLGGNMFTRQMSSPVFIPASRDMPLQPVYPATAGLSSKVISTLVSCAFRQVGGIEDYMPREILSENGLPGLYEALKGVHFPKTAAMAEKSAARLSFDELFTLQLGLHMISGNRKKETPVKVRTVNIDDFLQSLPYRITRAQFGALKDILLDFKSGYVMNRLLQGDVGSGKTVVAMGAMYCMAKNGYQSCMMAPTEILANQHFENVSAMLAPFGVRVGLLTASMKARRQKRVRRRLENGEIDILIGTHSVIGEKVRFKNLALFVTDEQHRFGVNQRNAGGRKGENPHTLVMSATPIPRTLAMVIYADMKISVIDRMPAGRKPVKTYLVGTDKRRRMFGFVQKHIDAGLQCYIVLPAIDENEEALGLASVNRYCDEVVKAYLPGARVASLHGRMKGSEKERIMKEFSEGNIDVLCSTTVVEVGVDVPKAALMVIENAERYGLSALHQLRGRVGRGSRQSYCILVSDKKSKNVTDRLKYLCRHSDGFEVSRYDLKNRGPGDFFGSRQHGLPRFRTAGLFRDVSIIDSAGKASKKILTESPDLSAYPLLRERVGRLMGNITL